jgi:VanZ family protein
MRDPKDSPVHTTTAPLPIRLSPPARRPPSRSASSALVLVRLLTVLVGLGTAAVTLGPRAWVVTGRAVADQWLGVHPTPAQLVAELGGVEPAGNLLLFVPFAALLALSVALSALPVALLVLGCLPVAVEWVQQVLPGRVPDGNDIVRNTVGLLVAFGTVALLRLAAFAVVRATRLHAV